jgi:hypothetical protein
LSPFCSFSDQCRICISILLNPAAHITSKALGQAQIYTWYFERSSPLRLCWPLSLCWKSSRITLWGRKRKRNLAEERFLHSEFISPLTPDRVLSLVGQVSAASGSACNRDTIWAGSRAPYLSGHPTNE